jgi:putative transposase
MVTRAYKTELDPNRVQRMLLLRHAGVARFAYNWGLARRTEEYAATGGALNAFALHKELNCLKKAQFPWMYEVSKCAPQEALRDLDRAFKDFFEHRGQYPRFKSRKRGVGRFRLTGAIRVYNDRVRLPRLGRVRLKEKDYLPTADVHILSATVSERAGHWFVSINVEEQVQVPVNQGPVVGVDVGVLRLATVSDGTVVENPRALRGYAKKLRRLQRSLSRRQKGSRNRGKARLRLARCHYRVSCIRRDVLHKATTMLAKTKSVIAVEDLAVKSMMKDHRLAGSLADASFNEFHRMLQYKAQRYGSVVVRADRFFPSTKTCSTCGTVKVEVKLSERWFKCEVCGSEKDRDLNAALNLEQVAASWAETINACERREVHGESQVLADEAGTDNGRIGARVPQTTINRTTALPR